MFNASTANWAAVATGRVGGPASVNSSTALSGGVAASTSSAFDVASSSTAAFQWYSGHANVSHASSFADVGSSSNLTHATSDQRASYAAGLCNEFASASDSDHFKRLTLKANGFYGGSGDKSGTSTQNLSLPPTDFGHSLTAPDFFYPRSAYNRAPGTYLDGTAPSLYTTFEWLNATSNYGKVAVNPAAPTDLDLLQRRQHQYQQHYHHQYPTQHVNGGGGSASNMLNAFSYGSLAGHVQFGAAAAASQAATAAFQQPPRPVEPMYPWMKYTGMVNGQTKRTRQTYSRQQTLELEKEFYSSRYLTRKRRKEISQTLRLTERQVKIWFQNRRMKWKKENRDDKSEFKSKAE